MPGDFANSGLCPMCKRAMDQAHRPFCSKRCSDEDLGRWLTGAYAVAAETDDLPRTNGDSAPFRPQ